MSSPVASTSCPPSASFAILGPIQVTVEGVRVRLGGPRQVAVLARLLLTPGHVVSLDQLVGSVWDGDAPARAEATVRSYLSNLRRTIEPSRHRGDRSSCIERQGPGYRLVVAPDQVDAVRFEQLVVDGRRALTADDPDGAVELLTAAARLWRGEPCADILATAPIVAYRSRLAELRLGATEALVEARLDRGEHDAVLPDLEVLTTRHPLRERLTELAMRALYAAGRQSDALAACRHLREQLIEELGVDPGPRIQQLERRILTHDPSLVAVPRPDRPSPTGGSPGPGADVEREPASPVGGPAGVPGAVSGDDSRPVGRDRELSALRDAVAGLDRGCGFTALVTGEPGSGKTALIETVIREHDGALLVARARCRTLARHQALWPWSQIIDDLVDRLGLGADNRMLAGLGSLSVLSPRVAAGSDGQRPALDDEPAPARLFQPVVELLRRATDDSPVVVVIDDAHGADAASLELVAHVGSVLATRRIGLVVVWRDTERGEQPTRSALRALGRLPAAVRLDIGGVDVRAAERLVAGSGAHPDLARRFHWASAGNPLLLRLLVEDAVRCRGSDDEVGPESPAGLTTPFDPDVLPPAGPGLTDAVVDRVERVDQRAPEILSLAALAARSLSAPVVAEAGRFPTDVVDEVLEGAVDAGLLVGGPGRAYLFVHPVVPAVLARRISPPRRARLHTALGHALWRAGASPADLAHQFSRAGSAASSILAARFALQCAAESTDPAELPVAAEAAASGLAAIERLGRADGLDVELTILLTHLARLGGEAGRFETLAARAVAVARRSGRDDLLVPAVLAASGADPTAPGPGAIAFLGHRPDPDRALVPVEGLLADLSPDDPSRPVLEVRRRSLLAAAGRPAPSAGRTPVRANPPGPERPPAPGPGLDVEQGVVGAGAGAGSGRDAQPADDRVTGFEPEVLVFVAEGPESVGRPRAPSPSSTTAAAGEAAAELETARTAAHRLPVGTRLDLAERLSSAARRWGRSPPEVQAARLRVDAHLELGSPDDAVRALHRARAQVPTDDVLARLELDTVDIDLALLQGRLADADPAIAGGRRRCRSHGLDPSAFERRLATLRWINGDLEDAERILLAVHGDDTRDGAIDRQVVRAALAADRGDADTAARQLATLVDDPRWPRPVTGHPALERAALLARAAQACDHRVVAGAVYPALVAHAAQLVTSRRGSLLPGPVTYPAALAALVLGRPDEAAQLLADAERRCRDIQARPCLVRTLVARAGLAGPPGGAVRSTDADPARGGSGSASRTGEIDLRPVVSGPLAEARAVAAEIARSLTDPGREPSS